MLSKSSLLGLMFALFLSCIILRYGTEVGKIARGAKVEELLRCNSGKTAEMQKFKKYCLILTLSLNYSKM